MGSASLASSSGRWPSGWELLKPLSAPSHLLEDAIKAGGPGEGFGVGIPCGEERIDGFLEVAHAME